MRKIACFHLFNDYSGSPKVLKVVIEGMIAKGYNVDLITSHGGVLDEIQESDRLCRKQYNYNFARNKFIRLMRYAWVQLRTFFIAFGYLFRKDTTIYINTILPIGAALGGRLAGKKVVYHYHENAKAKSLAYRILAKIMQFIASDIICVSHYQRKFLRRKKRIYVVPNALQSGFAQKLEPDSDRAFKQQRVLMLGSLKEYKGTREFIELAGRLEGLRFELVINDSQENIDKYLKERDIAVPANLAIHPRQEDVSPFYNRASLVLNLSNRRLAVETFGLTALEAMTAGLPVIVPSVGGIAEMVTDGVNGYKIDVQEIEKIEEIVKKVLSNKELYITLCNNSLEYSKKYSAQQMVDNIGQLLL